MSEDLVISQCSPTMAGLKTGNLFTCPMEDKNTLNESIRRMNMKLVPRGVRLLPVKYRVAGSALYASGSLLRTIFSFTTSIKISLLHLGQ